MPYDITTKDGITLRNIPDSVAPDSPELKARVASIRSGNASKPLAINEGMQKQEVPLSERVSNFGHGAAGVIAAPLVGVAQRLGLEGSQNRADAWREDMADTAQKPGGMGGQLFGGAAAALPIAMAPGANTILGGGVYGAMQGFTQPTKEGESPAQNTLVGTVAGAAIPAVVKTAKTIKAAAMDPFTEAGRDRIAGSALRRAAGTDADAVATALSTARGNTPGFTPSVAQAANNDGVSAFERTMRAINPQAFNELDKSQRAALSEALLSIAKTPEERAAAVAFREQSVNPFYSAAKRSTAQGDTVIDALLNRPSMQAAVPRAVNLANERGANFSMPTSTPAKTVPTGVLDANGNPITTQTPYKPAQYPGTTLHDLKMGLDDAIGTPGIGGMQGAERNAALNTKQEYLNWLESKIPAYGQARQTYEQLSQPINQMDIGREFYNRFVPALADQGAVPFRTTAQNYANALLRNGDDLARNVTGMKGITLEGTMTPEQMDLLRGVAKDSMAKAAAEAGGRGAGSDTVQKMSMSHLASEAGIPNWMASIARVPGGWAKRAGDVLYGNADEQVRQRLAYLLTNPQEAAQVMAGMPPKQRAIAEMLLKGTQAGAMGIPALSAE